MLPHCWNPAATFLFAGFSRFLLRRNFHGVFALRELWHRPDPRHPHLFFVTHTSWWDPVVAAELCRRQWGLKRILGPMDEQQLLKNKILRNVGVFGVKKGEARQVGAYLRSEMGGEERTHLWIHAPGSFVPNERGKFRFQGAVGHWAFLHSALLRSPVAVHYFMGTLERKAKIFVACGEGISARTGDPHLEKKAMEEELSSLNQRLLEAVYTAHTGTRFVDEAFEKIL